MNLNWYSDYKQRCDDYLNVFFDDYVSEARSAPQKKLAEACQYAVMSGGKRLRMVLGMVVAELGQDDRFVDQVVPTLASLELMHTYSLVHDDLPCMDADELRRGQPTVWKQYDETTAVLAGDLLQSLAFENITDHFPRCTGSKLCRVLAQRSGVHGLVGGQMEDIFSGTDIDEEALVRLHRKKTGQLFAAAGLFGCIISGYQTAEQMKWVKDYCEAFGLAFQIRDDVLDVEGDPVELGKAVGQDTDKGYVAILGLSETKKRLRFEIDKATVAADEMGSEKLRELAESLQI